MKLVYIAIILILLCIGIVMSVVKPKTQVALHDAEVYDAERYSTDFFWYSPSVDDIIPNRNYVKLASGETIRYNVWTHAPRHNTNWKDMTLVSKEGVWDHIEWDKYLSGFFNREMLIDPSL